MKHERSKRNTIIQAFKALKLNYTDKLYNRIQFLQNAVEEEYPYDDFILSQSLEGFLIFMGQEESFIYPNIVITPEGNIRIFWKNDSIFHFSIEFLSKYDAKIILISPDPGNKMKKAITSSKITIDGIMNIIKPLFKLEWITE